MEHLYYNLKGVSSGDVVKEELDDNFLTAFFPTKVRITRYFMYQRLYHQLQTCDMLKMSGNGIIFGGNSLIGQFFPSVQWKVTNLEDGFDVRDTSNIEEKYDLIILDQVLEHVDFPWIVPEQLSSILNYNGCCIITTPFMYPIHNDSDYYRFTDKGLEKLFSFFFNPVVGGGSGSFELLQSIIKIKQDELSKVAEWDFPNWYDISTTEFRERYRQWVFQDRNYYVFCWFVGRKKWSHVPDNT